MDDFEKAVQLCVDPSVNAQVRHEAHEYCERLKSSNDGWIFCARQFSSGAYSNETTLFACLQVIEHCLKNRYETFSEQEKVLMKEFLCSWLQNRSSETDVPSFIRNKMAQIFALMFRNEFLQGWPSFFDDILSIMSTGGAPIVDMFLRILESIDEVVVDRVISRSSRQLSLNSEIKDQMRMRALPKIAQAWLQVLSTFQTSAPQLCVACLSRIEQYIAWIDIKLVVNEHFLPLLFENLQHLELREASCDCITAITSKGMDGIAKVQLIQSLNIIQMLTTITPTITDDENNEFLLRLGRLCGSVGESLIIAYSKMSLLGEDVAVCCNLIQQIFPLVCGYFTHEDDSVSEAMLPFLFQYVGHVKQVKDEHTVSNLESLLQITVQKMIYDEYDFDHEGEDEALFMQFRDELDHLFDNIASVIPEGMVQFSQSLVLSTLSGENGVVVEQQPYNQVELALHVLCLLGRAVPKPHYSKEQAGSPMDTMMTMLSTCSVASHEHHAVIMEYFHTIVRHRAYFNLRQEQLANVLPKFLSESGTGHWRPSVRSRVCYLLLKLLKGVDVPLQQYSGDVIDRLQPLLSEEALLTEFLRFDDQLFLYEAAGFLIVAHPASSEDRIARMQVLLTPLLERFNQILTSELPQVPDVKTQVRLCTMLVHIMGAVTRVSKAFPNLKTLDESGCKEMLWNAVNLFVLSLKIPVQRTMVCDGVRVFLHRMIIVFGESLLPIMPVAVEQLLDIKDCSAQDLTDFIPLINQMISKFKKNFAPYLTKLFTPIIQAVYGVLSQEIDPADTQIRVEHDHLRRAHFGFINTIIVNKLTPIMLDPENQVHLVPVLTTIVQGGTDLCDPLAQKTCFNILRRLVNAWMKPDLPISVEFREFVLQQIVPACVQAPLRPTFDVQDGQSWLTLVETTATLIAVFEAVGQDLITYLQGLLPTISMQDAAIHAYLSTLQQKDKSALAKLVKNMIRGVS